MLKSLHSGPKRGDPDPLDPRIRPSVCAWAVCDTCKIIIGLDVYNV